MSSIISWLPRSAFGVPGAVASIPMSPIVAMGSVFHNAKFVVIAVTQGALAEPNSPYPPTSTQTLSLRG
jgi:hypothetical protein